MENKNKNTAKSNTKRMDKRTMKEKNRKINTTQSKSTEST
jgi:hypothetical protein